MPYVGEVDMGEKNQGCLNIGFCVGTRAIDTYDKCCELVGFKKSQRGKFGKQQLLYAQDATPEGYSVWMLAHSNLNEDFNRNKKWYNIFADSETIKEIWLNPSDFHSSQSDKMPRVCFAKNRIGEYVFKGVYMAKEIGREKINGRDELVRTFKRISSTYPIGKVYVNTDKQEKSTLDSSPDEYEEIAKVVDMCLIKAHIIENNKDTTIVINVNERPIQKELIGKSVGEKFKFPNVNLTYEIKRILIIKNFNGQAAYK